MNMKRKGMVIGIDFGVSKTTLSYWDKTHTEIIPTKDGSRYTPSCIYYTEKERLIGEAAVNYPPRIPENRLFDLRRILGCKASDSIITKMRSKGYDNIVSDSNERVKIKLKYFGERKLFPEHITGVFLKKVKQQAEEYMKRPITSAVFSIPYAYTKVQSDALVDAADIAGIEVLKMVNESSLAALDYSLRINKETVIMIFNFGAGFLDLGVFKVNSGKCQTLILGGSKEIGGDDINSIIIEDCLRECENQYGYLIRKNPKTLAKMVIACEKAKHILSVNKETTIEIENIASGADFVYTLTREKVESMCESIFKKCIDCVREMFEREEIDKSIVDDVILVGGSTRIPKIKSMLQLYFNKAPLSSINADEAVANGAAIVASMASGPQFSVNLDSPLSLVEIFPHNILFNESLLVQKNSCIPFTFAKTLSLTSQERALIHEVIGSTKECIGYVETNSTGKIFNVQIGVDNKNFLSLINAQLKINWIRNLSHAELKYAKYQEQEFDKQESEDIKTKVLRNEYELYINEQKRKIEELKKSNSINNQTEKLSDLLIKQELDWVEKSEKIVETQYERKKDYITYILGLIFEKRLDALASLNELSKEFGDELTRMVQDEKKKEEKLNNLEKLYKELETKCKGSFLVVHEGIKYIKTISKELTSEEIEGKTEQLKAHLKTEIQDIYQLINKY